MGSTSTYIDSYASTREIKAFLENELRYNENWEKVGFSHRYGEVFDCYRNKDSGEYTIGYTKYTYQERTGRIWWKSMSDTMGPYTSSLCPKKYLKLIKDKKQGYAENFYARQMRRHEEERIFKNMKPDTWIIVPKAIRFSNGGEYVLFRKTYGKNDFSAYSFATFEKLEEYYGYMDAETLYEKKKEWWAATENEGKAHVIFETGVRISKGGLGKFAIMPDNFVRH